MSHISCQKPVTNPRVACVKVPVDTTPGAQFAIMSKRHPGAFLEQKDCLQGDLPVVFSSEKAAIEFAKNMKASCQIVPTSDARYFMKGDEVYLFSSQEA